MKIIKKGFTLIELLVVIGILAVLMAGVVALINPADKNKQAQDSKVQSDVAQLATAAQSYAAQSSTGSYPSTTAQLTTAGELVSIPTQPGGVTAYVFTPGPAGCNGAATPCTSLVISGTLKSLKYTGFLTWRWDSATGKACPWSGAACMTGF